MNQRKLALSGLAVLILIVAAVGASMLVASKEEPEKAEIATVLKPLKVRSVANESVPTRIEITGRLVPRQRIELYAEVGGVLKPESKRFREGNYFKKGAPLIEIDNEEHDLNLVATKSSLLNQITLMLPDLKADYTEGFPDWKAYVDQFDPTVSIKDLPEPKTDSEKYFVSARNIYNLFYQIKSQEARSAKYTILAPFSGIVSQSNITEGTLVRVGQKMGEFTNTFTYELEAAVNLKDLDFIKVGNKVRLTSNDIAGDWQGTIQRISDRIDATTQTAKVFVSASGKNLREGMYLTGTIAGRNLDEVVEVKRSLLRNEINLFVVQDSILKEFKVTPVQYTTETVLVRGLENGTVILDEDAIGIYDGLKIAPYSEADVKTAVE
ncbi:efflux RND transporter periplasmic adaptor subunit [Pontibacter sp. G13]|uniref:efflux RND transporter periplasmic adaptor subunit n=1 Tax=Pontibacter sp. G13 TaxID=3074898 RepID=UPI00288A6FA1|nr:efflux RND transporter periplasmic adaptor subunit [Pontibacter sp. G13]WNJ16200.1 efflux RND transporter periplasmic adaptor subunit [Pontibacter sp. G13]